MTRALLLAAALLPALAGCGRAGPPRAPGPAEAIIYPRAYPRYEPVTPPAPPLAPARATR